MRKRKISRYGWKPDLPDNRDHVFEPSIVIKNTLPPNVDLRAKCPLVYDQGQIGSCTANAIGGAVEFDVMRQNLSNFMPSRNFIYYNERAIENSISTDSGAQIRDGIKSVNQLGVCSESIWPYDGVPANPDTNIWPKNADAGKKPTAACYTAALKNQVTSYQSVVRNLNDMKACLAAGFPFVFGFTVYSAFESDEVAKTGVLNMPAKGEQVEGGHAVMCVGYDDASQRFIVRNSWGSTWGQAGYFTIPYDYLMSAKLSSDFWTLRMVK